MSIRFVNGLIVSGASDQPAHLRRFVDQPLDGEVARAGFGKPMRVGADLPDDILLGPAQLYEALRAQPGMPPAAGRL
ncbi:hypothetical protein [Cupriavidus consociatus]|uniref:hypothetical protein n=1 Tax=Cupriavidus consociatus TaxID=2821357 RepID=UPI001AE82D80|nr:MULTISPECIES: hypothetical protein [unclassified Cupriavidus]MBP0620442.1 hypothetical protein [Cupriavidus sp. LEh25]MDK2657099.1 hypothetical protein [Cupriavidus sp. LEh21]